MTTYYNYLGQAMAVSANPTSYVKDDGGANGQAVGHVTLTANPGPSAVDSNGGNYDTLIGGSGDDIFYVTNNTDVVQVANGLPGIKSVVSWSGGFTLPANVQNLTFYGAGNWGAGNSLDNLIIMGGNDLNTMDGGAGNDVLVGGLGENDFQFEVGAGGHDVFYNFHPTADTVRIAGASFTSFAQIQSAMTQVGSDVKLTINASDSILFRGVNVADFQARDFLLPLDHSQLGALTFSDDFNSLQLFNPATGQGKWQTNFGGDPTKLDTYAITSNDEKQVYTAPGFVGEDGRDLSAYSPFSISGGVLDITTGAFSYADSQHTWGQAYYSGMLNSRDVFMQKFGYFEMRAVLPTTLGTWPGFWMSQDPYKPGVEADLLEHLAIYPDANFARSNDAGVVTGHSTYMPSLSGMHTYGMLWGATTTTFYIDDMAVLQVATPASWDKPMYMLLNLALGGWGGPIDASGLPAQMQVDYVHVYGLAAGPVQTEEGYATYTAPSGVNAVTLIGTGQTVTANDGGDTLIGTVGADTFLLGRGGDTVTGGGGLDTFKINATPWAAGHVIDFSTGDKLDLSGLLAAGGYSGSNPMGDGAISIVNGSGSAQIWAHLQGQNTLLLTLDGEPASRLGIQGSVITGQPLTHTAYDINDDSRADLLFRSGSTGDLGFMSANAGGGQTWTASGGTSTAYASLGLGDFNGDGVADAAFRNSTSGDWGFMSLSPNGGETWHPMGPSSTAYAAVGVADFNSDGSADIAFRNGSTGDFGYMSVSVSGAQQWHAVGATSTAYTGYGAGDFNGDGVMDVLFRNNANGDLGFMSVNPGGGETWRAMGPSSTGYAVIGLGDFNGDGHMDVAFRNTTTGDWGYMSASPPGSETWIAVGASSMNYSVLKVGDFDNSGHAEVAFRNNTTGGWGYMSANVGGGETWHDIGSTSLDYFVL